MFNEIPNAQDLSIRAKEVNKFGKEEWTHLSMILTQCSFSANNGEFFAKFPTSFHNEKVEKYLREEKGFSIGPDFNDEDGQKCFSISWPEE